jgi:hypothetical protein
MRGAIGANGQARIEATSPAHMGPAMLGPAMLILTN